MYEDLLELLNEMEENTIEEMQEKVDLLVNNINSINQKAVRTSKDDAIRRELMNIYTPLNNKLTLARLDKYLNN